MQPVLEHDGARRARPDANVLITGEHGTGQGSGRAAGCTRRRRAPTRPLVTVNAGGLRRGRLRERAVRAREGGVHRRANSDRVGCFELADERHALPGRDRQRARCTSRPSCCACSRPARSERVGSSEVAAGGRARALGHQRRPAGAGRARAASARTCSIRLNTVEASAPRRCAARRGRSAAARSYFLQASPLSLWERRGGVFEGSEGGHGPP